MKLSAHTIIFLFAALLLTIGGCSEYNKVLKSTDIEYKYTKAIEYYNDESYYKALPILEELIGLTRGTQRAEDVYYYYAKSHFGVEDFYLANYYLKTFNKTFSNSPRSEECLFLAAECSYQLSPSYSLDQTDTRNAIDEYQLFLDKYPHSHLKDSANHQIDRLNFKLERKAFENASQFAKTLKYKAAVSALKDFLREYPASQYREEAMYLIVKCQYLLAEGSIEEKKLERMRAVGENYRTFAAAFPESAYLADAESYFRRSERQVEKLSSISIAQPEK
ncbi:MAG: outer membrane protein assembly factor BamD [Flavobacteriales bacterium]|jgi:outer membrane protein assembly factor BamD